MNQTFQFSMSLFSSGAVESNLIFFARCRSAQSLQRLEELMVAITTSALPPFEITGKICRKSPPITTTFSPNGQFSLFGSLRLIISFKVLSKASKQCMWIGWEEPRLGTYLIT
ncbi:unnamed protein product [Cuscuta epithymum]|uniref:Uncharacterized protein n=1 Tax=Cuscuta epithymum TaxID=186058 RepID=A0AAV0GK86_9ASTE|nr:unnamed protein product [Cuscuta epithymum]